MTSIVTSPVGIFQNYYIYLTPSQTGIFLQSSQGKPGRIPEGKTMKMWFPLTRNVGPPEVFKPPAIQESCD